ncbi:hypothetical protein B0H19DRAFT_1264243 [Mycena capillaripes]|nr:hypothetical protein B0H19DRAFT_1264243 [Mycena capillaripes]
MPVRYQLGSNIASFIRDVVPHVTALYFVLVDCTATYCAWDTYSEHPRIDTIFPPSLTELHVTFAYTSPPPSLLLDAPRGTFFPPPLPVELPKSCNFGGVRRLVVETTAKFYVEDVPQTVPADVKARLAFVRLTRTETWALTGADAVPIPDGDKLRFDRKRGFPTAHALRAKH